LIIVLLIRRQVRSILDSKDYAVDSGVFSNLKFYNRILDTFASLSASRQAGILRFYQEFVQPL
jgi:hypothetical protein